MAEETDTLLDAVERSVERAPDAIAIVAGGERYTYARLWSGASAIALALEGRGLNRGDRIALLAENSFQYVIGYYGILLAGGVTVPLNAQARIRDLESWVRHSQARIVLADSSHRETESIRTRCPDVELLIIDRDGPTQAVSPDISRDRPYSGDLASILYTSGTTGRPKGVMLSHGNLSSNVRSILAYLRLTEDDSVLCVLPFTYSYGNSVLHTHLVAGARIVIDNQMAFPARILERLGTEAVTGFSGVPSTFALLLDRGDPRAYRLERLRYLTQAGGPMSRALTARVREAFPKAELFIMYGQTEATARLSYLPPEKLDEKAGSVGIAIPGVRLEVRDESGSPVEHGITGEIWAQGANVMQGYWRDPSASSAALSDGWLRTGDLARMDHHGYLYITGRASDMIKTGAHRVSPQDIEDVIAQVDGVADVAVLGVDDEILGQVIKAVVVPSPGAPLTMQSILAHCRSELALYKIPKEIAFAESLPRTASGKVQRHLLR